MSLGFTELMIILLLVLILFGAGKLPKVMGDLGKGIKSFQDGFRQPNNTDTPSSEPENKLK